MTKVIKKLILLILMSSQFAWAHCGDLRADSRFNVVFKINNAQLTETVVASKKNNSRPLDLWSNNFRRHPIIRDGETTFGGDYHIWLKYEETSNKTGDLSYYMYESGTSPVEWKLIELVESADLSSIKSVPIKVTGLSIDELSCSKHEQVPELPELPDTPEYSENAQFEFGSAVCSSSSCSFELTKDYQYTPIVILMPTVGQQDDGANGANPDSDAPASAFLKSVDIKTKQVSFDIKRPAITGGSSQQMVNVDYLVVEPGIADFNGHTVVAGYVDTNKQVYIDGPGESDNHVWSMGGFADFGLKSAFPSNPVVLTQMQSANNNKWLTAAMRSQSKSSQIAANQGVELSLELSRSRGNSHSYQVERIGYIATLAGNGKVDGYKFNFGKLTTPHVTGSQPLEQGCSTLYDLGLNNISNVVATKMERHGGHGGWLRRCRISGNKASFIVDEDHYERSHLAESVGYFTVELDYKLPQYCEFFKGAVQSHSPSGDILINGNAFVLGEPKEFQLGFSTINKISDGWGVSHKSCRTYTDSWQCEVNEDLIVDPVDLPSFPNNGSRESYYDGQTHVISKGIYQEIEAGSTSILVFEESGDYWVRKLTLNESSKLKIVKGTKVRLFVEHLQTNVTAEVNHEGNPDDFLLVGVGNNANIHLTGETTFNGLVYSENKVTLDSSFGFNDDVSLMPTTITGAVTAKDVEMNSSSNVRGSSLCFSPPEQDYQLRMTPSDDLSLLCERQPVELQVTDDNGAPASGYQGQLIITTKDSFPSGKAFWYSSETGGENGKKDISLENTFDVDSNGKAVLWLKSDYVGTIEVIAKLSTDSTKQAVGNYQFVPFKLEIQQGELKTVANKPRDISIVAKACSDESGDDSIAKGFLGTRTLKLKTEYSEPKSGAASIFLLDKYANWQSGSGKFEFKAEANQDGTKTVRAHSSLKYADAGRTKLTIYDPNCTREKCNIEPISRMMKAKQSSLIDWQRLEGVQAVATRPYTFALCNDDNQETPIQSATGTSEAGNAFVASGAEFGLKVKPVVWVEKEDSNRQDIDGHQNATSPVDSRGMCSRKETLNFYADGAPKATVVLSIPGGKPHSPTKKGALSGTLTSAPLSNSQIKDTPFSATWDEVGSIWLQADTKASYLGMDINQGQRPVGRFYPDYLAVVQRDSGIQYPAGQGFVYMDQPFEGRVKIEARNVNDQPTKNYGYFASGLQVGLEMEAVDADIEFGSKNRLSKRVDWSGLPTGWSKGWQGAHNTVEWSPLMFQRKVASFAQGSKGRITTADGPFNVALGVLTEDLSFEECEKIGCPEISGDMDIHYCGPDENCNEPRAAMKFGQFNTRYGRMVMKDAAGRADSNIAIPLRVEFWNGIEFMVNNEDSVSEYDGRYSCKQIITNSADKLEQGESSNSYTQGSGKVRNGDTQSGQFVAVPHQREGKPVEGYREQVRFWQRLTANKPNNIKQVNKAISCIGSHSSQPWLLYNWRQLGDENPSAVVTFGVYRGNDRIIYRGEKGINTLLN